MSEIRKSYPLPSGGEVEVATGLTNVRFVRVLEAMLWGIEAKIAGHRARLAETDTGGYKPVCIMTMTEQETNKDKEVVLGADMTLEDFSSAVERHMSDGEYDRIMTEYAASRTLTEINRGKL